MGLHGSAATALLVGSEKLTLEEAPCGWWEEGQGENVEVETVDFFELRILWKTRYDNRRLAECLTISEELNPSGTM